MLHHQIADTRPIHYQKATALAALIRTKQLSSREVVQAHLDRIEAVNPKINAIVTSWPNRRCRRRRGRHSRGQRRAAGPLHGVPFSIKDCSGHRGRPHPTRLEAVRRQHSRQGRHRGRTLQGRRRHSAR